MIPVHQSVPGMIGGLNLIKDSALLLFMRVSG
jgi:hypothetical protein